jgi:hypothetical protein
MCLFREGLVLNSLLLIHKCSELVADGFLCNQLGQQGASDKEGGGWNNPSLGQWLFTTSKVDIPSFLHHEGVLQGKKQCNAINAMPEFQSINVKKRQHLNVGLVA